MHSIRQKGGKKRDTDGRRGDREGERGGERKRERERELKGEEKEVASV